VAGAFRSPLEIRVRLRRAAQERLHRALTAVSCSCASMPQVARAVYGLYQRRATDAQAARDIA
jgi:hypothetical protein